MNKLIHWAICFFLVSIPVLADSPPKAEGLMILRSTSGYDLGDILFTRLTWTSFYGGTVTDTNGQKSTFANKEVSRIVYFDADNYSELDNDPPERAFRAGIQTREVVANTSFFNLLPSDVESIQKSQANLEGIEAGQPAIQSLLQPQVDSLNEDRAKLSGGQVLVNGKWMTREEANAQTPPIIGGGVQTCTFTTKDGKKYVNVKVEVMDTGLSVVTSDGGTTIPFDTLSDDLSALPKKIQSQIESNRQVALTKSATSADRTAFRETSNSGTDDYQAQRTDLDSVPRKADTQSEPEISSIKEVDSDRPTYRDKRIKFSGEISISNGNDSGYDYRGVENDFFAFQITDENGSASVYGSRDGVGGALHRELFSRSKSGTAKGKLTITLSTRQAAIDNSYTLICELESFELEPNKADNPNAAQHGISSTSGESDGTIARTGTEVPEDHTEKATPLKMLGGIALDGNGNLYVSDNGNNTICKLLPDGGATILAGRPGEAGSTDGKGDSARFNGPCGLAVDSVGNIYVTDNGNSTIRKITPTSVVTTLAGSAGQTGCKDGTGADARFNLPCGAAVDANGNIYVTELGNSSLRKVTASGVVTTFAGGKDFFKCPGNVANDKNGNLYVTDYGKEIVYKVSSDGTITPLAGSADQIGSSDGIGGEARFKQPRGVSVDIMGNVYVADMGTSTIRKITPGGVVTTLAGTPQNTIFGLVSIDGMGGEAQFNMPSDLVVDKGGNIYVIDGGNTIRKITQNGVVTTLGDSEAK